MINLQEHKYFEYEKKIEVVPYHIAQKALDDLVDQYENKLDEALSQITTSLTQINKVIEEND
jgi:uncharacterized protein YbgA (DUF1722 family)